MTLKRTSCQVRRCYEQLAMESLHNPHAPTVGSPRSESTRPAPPQSLVIVIKTPNTPLSNMAPTLREETTAPQSYSTEEAQRLLIAESRAAEKAEAKAAKAKARTKATILRKPAGVTKSDLKSGCKLLSTSRLPICFHGPTTNTLSLPGSPSGSNHKPPQDVGGYQGDGGRGMGNVGHDLC